MKDWMYGVLGAGIGIGGIIAYNELVEKRKPVPINLFIEKEELRNSVTGVTFSLIDENKYVIVENVPMLKQGDVWTVSLDIRKLKGNYIAKISLISTEASMKEFNIVLPNAIGLSIPYGKIYEKKDAIEIRWV